jgi:hypothetical protein
MNTVEHLTRTAQDYWPAIMVVWSMLMAGSAFAAVVCLSRWRM